MQSQIVCNGCRSVLLYPRGATSVCCAVCNTITSVRLPGMDTAQLICGGCRTLLMYNRRATSVRCSCCNMINLATSEIELIGAMGNEIGNSKFTGFEASELDNAEAAAKAIMSSDSLKATEKYDAEDVATNEPLKDVIVSNGADTTNMVNQANIEEKRMESIEDDPKQTEEQNQQESSEESDGTVATNIVNEANLQKESDQAHLVAAEDEQDQQKSSEKKEEEMKSNSALDALSRKEETQPILLVDLENNKGMENPRITSAESYDADLKERKFSNENKN